MFEIFEAIISILINDATLTAIVPATNIYTGRADVVMESQTSLGYPAIVLSQASEVFRSVPTNARDTLVQLDIWSRNSQLELETIYEQVLLDLTYLSENEGTAHIFWNRLSGAVDVFETDRAIWHRSLTFSTWSIKP